MKTITHYSMKSIIALLLFGAVFSCQQKDPEHFGDFVDISKIDKVEMHNTFGNFELTGPQLEMFKRELENLTPDFGSYKTGGISVKLTIRKKEYVLTTNTNGDYIECPAAMITKNKDYFGDPEVAYFKVNGVNFDNFKQ